MNLVINFVAFQLGWFACVIGAANGLPWGGSLVVLAVVALHLARVRRPLPELRLVGLAMALGLVVDSLLLATGWLSYPSGNWLPGMAPYWIVAMWALFATTLNVSVVMEIPHVLVEHLADEPIALQKHQRLPGDPGLRQRHLPRQPARRHPCCRCRPPQQCRPVRPSSSAFPQSRSKRVAHRPPLRSRASRAGSLP